MRWRTRGIAGSLPATQPAEHKGSHLVGLPSRMGIASTSAQGAVVMIWQPRRRAQAGLVDAPGALALSEFVTSDLNVAAAFLQRVVRMVGRAGR